jgi:site-specific DNA recombinase
MVVVGGSSAWRAYGCSGNKYGGAAVCANGISVRQKVVEERLLAPIKADLLSPERLEALGRRVAQKVAAGPKAANTAPRISELRRQIENLAEAIANGALRASPALAERLAAGEAELGRLTAQAAKPTTRITDFPARLTARFNKAIDKLEEYLARDPNRARAALREVCGEISLFPHKSGEYLVAKLGLSETLLRAVVGSEKFVVAGVGFEPTTFGL